ncbi:MAG: hypothetical protein LJE61_12940 [Thiocapsa sp.]|nr:hypothetical protein [Thiocapsa sp.]MCG6986090.1 hypothetical protein [Thiocapsa sp.]
MSNHSLHHCYDPDFGSGPDQPALERNRYFPRKLMTAEDMRLEQEYFSQKLRRHNRFLHGWGVVCGLGVTADSADDAPPWQVVIEPGYALGPYGDEIYVADPVHLDLAQCIEGTGTDPCDPGTLNGIGASQGAPLYIAIRYAECNTAPVRVMPEGCACSGEACEYSRTRDSFELRCLSDLPASHLPDTSFELCDAGTPPCPPCPEDPWVVLARITLPTTSTGTPIAEGDIEMQVRRRIYSTAILQQALIRCCCSETGPVGTLRVTDVVFMAGDDVEQSVSESDGQPFAQPLTIESQRINRLQVRFSQPIDSSSISCVPSVAFDRCSIKIEKWDQAGSLEPVQGSYLIVDQFSVALSPTSGVPNAPPQFASGDYRLTLFGLPDSDNRMVIRALNGLVLDGELVGEGDGYKLPSGDGQQGGNFEFRFHVGSA